MEQDQPPPHEVVVESFENGQHESNGADHDEHVAANDGDLNPETDIEMQEPIPTSLRLLGVDKLSTQQVKQYLDLHIRPKYSFATRQEYAYLEYRLDWINDSEINVIFDYNINKMENERRRKSRRDVASRRAENSKLPDLFDELRTLKHQEGENDMVVEGEQPAEVPEVAEELEEEMKEQDDATLQAESVRGAAEAIMLLTDFDDIRREHVEFSELIIEDQFTAVHQAPKLQDRKCWDLVLDSRGKIMKTEAAKAFYKVFEKVVLKKEDVDEADEAESSAVVPDYYTSDEYKVMPLEVRYSTRADKKVKDARIYSRYYLLNGEPDKEERLPPARERAPERGRGGRRPQRDLITGEEPETQGLFGFEADHTEADTMPFERPERRPDPRDDRRWENDRYYDSQRRPSPREEDDYRGFSGRGRGTGRGRGRGRGRGGRDRGTRADDYREDRDERDSGRYDDYDRRDRYNDYESRDRYRDRYDDRDRYREGPRGGPRGPRSRGRGRGSRGLHGADTSAMPDLFPELAGR